MNSDTSWERGFNDGIRDGNLTKNGQTLENRLLQLVILTEKEIEDISAWNESQPQKGVQLRYQEGYLAGLRKGLKTVADKEGNGYSF